MVRYWRIAVIHQSLALLLWNGEIGRPYTVRSMFVQLGESPYHYGVPCEERADRPPVARKSARCESVMR